MKPQQKQKWNQRDHLTSKQKHEYLIIYRKQEQIEQNIAFYKNLQKEEPNESNSIRKINLQKKIKKLVERNKTRRKELRKSIKETSEKEWKNIQNSVKTEKTKQNQSHIGNIKPTIILIDDSSSDKPVYIDIERENNEVQHLTVELSDDQIPQSQVQKIGRGGNRKQI